MTERELKKLEAIIRSKMEDIKKTASEPERLRYWRAYEFIEESR